jgi:hypothetical protein
MGRIIYDPVTRWFSSPPDYGKASMDGRNPSLLSKARKKAKEVASGVGQRLKDAVRRHAPTLVALGTVGTAFALSNGRRNRWGKSELERNKKKKAEGMTSEDPEVRKKAERMPVMPRFKTIVATPGYDTSPGIVSPYRQ